MSRSRSSRFTRRARLSAPCDSETETARIGRASTGRAPRGNGPRRPSKRHGPATSTRARLPATTPSVRPARTRARPAVPGFPRDELRRSLFGERREPGVGPARASTATRPRRTPRPSRLPPDPRSESSRRRGSRMQDPISASTAAAAVATYSDRRSALVPRRRRVGSGSSSASMRSRIVAVPRQQTFHSALRRRSSSSGATLAEDCSRFTRFMVVQDRSGPAPGMPLPRRRAATMQTGASRGWRRQERG
jgi:hypothetical protein